MYKARVPLPLHLKIIGECAFEDCENLCKIDIHPNSELETIDKEAFSYSSIEKFSIPLHLKTIGERAFEDCENLRKINIHPDSEMQTIGKYAFNYTLIESFWVPT